MRVAIIGASNNRQKYGNKAVRSYQARGYEVYPVNPNETTIEGIRAWPSIEAIPHPMDKVLMYVPPSVGITLLPALKACGAGEIYLNPGSESPELLASAEQLGLNTILACAILEIGDSPSRWE